MGSIRVMTSSRYAHVPHALSLPLAASTWYMAPPPSGAWPIDAYKHRPPHPTCRKCRKPVDRLRVVDDPLRKTLSVRMQCHGEEAEDEITYLLVRDGLWPPSPSRYFAFGPTVEVGTL